MERQWDESKHPRDDEGKFTFKYGNGASAVKLSLGDDEEQAPILKGRVETTEKNEDDIPDSKCKDILFDVLGDFLKPAQILYSNIGELGAAAIKLALENKLKTLKNMPFKTAENLVIKILHKNPKLKENLIKIIPEDKFADIIGNGYNSFLHSLAKRVIGENTAGFLDLSHKTMINPDFIKDTMHFEDCYDEKLGKYKDSIQKNIVKQFRSYSTKLNAEKIDGYYFKPNSKTSGDILQSKELQDFIIKNKDMISDCKNADLFDNPNYKGKEYSIQFTTQDLYYALGKVHILDCVFDDEGDVHILIDDTNDYNKNEDINVVKAGAKAMDKGELEGRFYLIEVIIPKEKVDLLLE